MKRKFFLALVLNFLFWSGCFWSAVQKDPVFPSDYRPQQYQRLAVINLDRKVQFSEYVEAELLRKGYQVKEWSVVRQVLKKEGLAKDESPDLETLTRIGNLLEVQGIVLCSVLDFSRFRESYRLSIKMVAPDTGNTVWSTQGALEGRRGQKPGELLKAIVVSSLKELPAVK